MGRKEFNKPSFSSTPVESQLRTALKPEVLPGAPDSVVNFWSSGWESPGEVAALSGVTKSLRSRVISYSRTMVALTREALTSCSPQLSPA